MMNNLLTLHCNFCVEIMLPMGSAALARYSHQHWSFSFGKYRL